MTRTIVSIALLGLCVGCSQGGITAHRRHGHGYACCIQCVRPPPSSLTPQI